MPRTVGVHAFNAASMASRESAIASSTFYAAQTHTPSKRQLRDAEPFEIITAARRRRFVAQLGARKLWLHLRRHGPTWPAARWNG